MLKRTLRISTITLCIFCTFFLICTGVFAATKQSSRVTTTVQFTPGIQVIITANVGGQGEQIIFNNSNQTLIDPNNNNQDMQTSPYFTTTSAAPTNFSSSNEIVIKIYNYTESANITSAIISLIDAKGAYLETYNPTTMQVTEVQNITFPTINADGGEAASQGFRIISLYQELDITMQIALESTAI